MTWADSVPAFYAAAFGQMKALTLIYRTRLKAEDADPRALLHALLNDMERVAREVDSHA